MNVVLDTGFASSLFKIGRLHLVKDVLGTDRAYVPAAVLTELSRCGFFRDLIAVVCSDGKTVSPDRWLIVSGIDAIADDNLGSGEREAIALAKKLKAVLLIDDRAAKEAAGKENVEAFDLSMFLLAGKSLGIIGSAQMKEIVGDLEDKDFYRFKKRVLDELLK